MATLPNTNIAVVPPEAPEDAEFPTPDPINTFDLVGPTAANRQPGAFKTRDLTLRDRVNLLVANMNDISTGDPNDSLIKFLPRDGTNPMTADLDMGGYQFTNVGGLLATPTSTPDDYVQVSAGTYQKTDGTGSVTFAGGSIQITTSVGGGQTRYDLVHIDDAGALTVTQGVAGTPGVVPDFPDDELMVAVIKVDETGAIVVNQADIADARPFLAADQNARALQTEPVDVTSPNTGDILQYLAGKWTPSAVVTLPTNYIGGLITSNNGSDLDHDIDIAKGQCRDVDDTENMVLSSVLTKRIDAAWAVGSGNGGLDTGSVAGQQLYLLWLIKRSDTGVVDAIFSILGLRSKVITISVDDTDDSYNDTDSFLARFKPGQTILVEGFTDGSNNGLKTVVTSAAGKITVAESLVTEAAGDVVTITAQVTSPTMPTNYDKRRLIGFVYTDGAGDIDAYTQRGDFFRYVTPHQTFSRFLSASLTWEVDTMHHLPPNCLAHLYASLQNAGSTSSLDGQLFIRPRGMVDGLGINTAFLWMETASNFDQMARKGTVLLDKSSQFELAAAETTGTAVVTVDPLGCMMLSRREP